MSTGAAFAAVLGLSGAPEPVSSSLDGEMATAPALMWERDLPGPLVQAAKHVELGTPLIDGDEVLLGALAKDAERFTLRLPALFARLIDFPSPSIAPPTSSRASG